MSPTDPAANDPAATDPAASTPGASDLDLAFSSDDDLAEELLNLAGPLADPLAGADLWHGRLSAWLDDLQADLPEALQSQAYSLGLQLVSDASIAALNQDWRSTSGPTDVLAFAAQDEDLEEPFPMPLPPQPDGHGQGDEPGEQDDDGDWGPAFGSLELGDIVISLDTAARQAQEHGHSLEQELLFLASHGLLHLLGWDHPDDASLAAMLARQEGLLAGKHGPHAPSA